MTTLARSSTPTLPSRREAIHIPRARFEPSPAHCRSSCAGYAFRFGAGFVSSGGVHDLHDIHADAGHLLATIRCAPEHAESRVG